MRANIMGNMEQQEATLVEKEDLSGILFSKVDVLADPVKRRLRQIYLEKAERLGNAYHGKVKMTFMTEEGKLMRVHTTIWSADNQYITLKGGVHIPTIAVVEVEFS
jgi:SUMO ligase MMS21 Smc5/6 complex component